MDDENTEQLPVQKQKHRRYRTGCFTCRQRKKRCDEAFNPVTNRCGNCSRLGLSCRVARTRLETVEQSGLIREQIRDGVNSTSELSAPTPILQSLGDKVGLSLAEDLSKPVDDEDLLDHRPVLAQGRNPKDSQTVDEIEILSPKTDAADESPARFSFFPYVLEQGQSSHIDYYRSNVISATSIILDEDTGLHQLIPKAFSAKHLMSALLAYSMAHRAQTPGDIALAESYRQQATTQYGKAIMALRSALSRKDDDFESLITSTLLLAATETTMGGVSDWYNHCIGANQLVRAFTTNINVENVAYHRFLIRYLMYHDVLGAVTMRQAPILDQSFYKREIAGLASDSTHPMVGANAKILSLMAKVCQLHEEAMEEKAQSEENDLNLALIYGNGADIEQRLMSLKLTPSLPLLLCFVTEAYRSSALLYLYQVLDEIEGNSMQSRFLEEKCEHHLCRLKQHIARVPLSSAPASALLFPLFMAGTCVKQPDDKEFVRSKLLELYQVVRFANILSALEALEVFWESPRTALGWQQLLRDRGWNLALT
ncbi:fungal-specific transcription factor domain-containing protein [Trichoderma sp. SZMC 28013]